MTQEENQQNATTTEGPDAFTNPAMPVESTGLATAETTVQTAPSAVTNEPDATVKNLSEKKMAKMSKKSNKQIKKIMKMIQDNQRKNQVKMKEEIERMKISVGKENFNALKAICTIQIPEKKDEQGNVIQAAANQVNFQALEKEVKNLLVLQREKRILEGKRKRSTGRSSDRKAHKARYKFLLNRNKETVENKEEASAVKV